MPVTTTSSYDELKRALSGVVAIPVTPFDADGAVDPETYAKLVDRLLTGGIDVVTPNGNTGEFYALDEAETRHCLELTVETAAGRATVVAGVGHDVATASRAARHAREAGADLIMIHQPVHPYVSAEGWVEYHRAIAASVPELGVVPYVRDTLIGGEQLARLADAAPNVIGVKYAVPDPVRFASVARDAGFDRFTWIAGLAELSAPGYFAVGATGFTSGLVNVAPSISLEMFRSLRDGDFRGAMANWGRIRPFEEMRAADSNANNVSVVKEALAQLGLCRSDVRPPSRPLRHGERDRVGVLLGEWGLR
ncbi:dihydrodipicolinate synthase family protein [Amycolatopsis regifaucium]|uniref:Dihydrodipicolinate synthase family protein n=1 Tax=Amycolatopsis regifaucium TaxID=546365 RepID=A0A154MLG4_9PSEU|nr:dihydrodipicolinate synthase family protein [Amycolatopsis regifaucium]KZB85214.1 dihydrodipicolinate synthase family protein [Amycolatopsis regifaucium]OKA03808.1 dihydrodipicolinate synthase family protein [Amycolatopsis regifaucium]SFH90102.1 4-hydroxy-tetrahydrodipicolinate synthase [Amycolatopsis regifaucium]